MEANALEAESTLGSYMLQVKIRDVYLFLSGTNTLSREVTHKFLPPFWKGVYSILLYCTVIIPYLLLVLEHKVFEISVDPDQTPYIRIYSLCFSSSSI